MKGSRLEWTFSSLKNCNANAFTDAIANKMLALSTTSCKLLWSAQLLSLLCNYILTVSEQLSKFNRKKLLHTETMHTYILRYLCICCKCKGLLHAASRTEHLTPLARDYNYNYKYFEENLSLQWIKTWTNVLLVGGLWPAACRLWLMQTPSHLAT